MNNLILKQSYKQTLHMTASMKKHMEILSMNSLEISKLLQETYQTNPFLEYSPSQDISNYLEDTVSFKKNLKDELYMQLHTQSLKYNNKICNYIIESLDNHGFFNIDLKTAIRDTKSCIDEFNYNLKLIQSFEPIGVAANNSIDSIAIQLKHKGYNIAAKILLNYENEIINHNLQAIADDLNISIDEIVNSLNLIKTCTPFPCSEYDTSVQEIIIPEFEIIVENDSIIINPKEIGNIQINDNGLEKEKDPMLKEYFKQAKFFIDSINRRNKTLLLITNELIEIHKGYFLYNDELKACTMKDISKTTGFAISTISRTISDKYYLFNNHLFALKDLFISKTKAGSSKDSIKKAIKYFIENENVNSPYEDEQLVDLLSNMELFVSRRTISKYRNELNIPNSKKRKRPKGL